MDKQICEAVAKYLAKVGIKVNLDVKPKSIYFTEVMENKHDFYMMGWFDGTYSGARTFFRHLHTIDKDAGWRRLERLALLGPGASTRCSRDQPDRRQGPVRQGPPGGQQDGHGARPRDPTALPDGPLRGGQEKRPAVHPAARPVVRFQGNVEKSNPTGETRLRRCSPCNASLGCPAHAHVPDTPPPPG